MDTRLGSALSYLNFLHRLYLSYRSGTISISRTANCLFSRYDSSPARVAGYFNFFISACYLIISVVYITGYFMDFDVACTKNIQQTMPGYKFFSKDPTLIVVQVREHLGSRPNFFKFSKTFLGYQNSSVYGAVYDFILFNDGEFDLVAGVVCQLVSGRCPQVVGRGD